MNKEIWEKYFRFKTIDNCCQCLSITNKNLLTNGNCTQVKTQKTAVIILIIAYLQLHEQIQGIQKQSKYMSYYNQQLVIFTRKPIIQFVSLYIDIHLLIRKQQLLRFYKAYMKPICIFRGYQLSRIRGTFRGIFCITVCTTGQCLCSNHTFARFYS